MRLRAASARTKVLFVAWRDLANRQAGGSEVVVDRLVSGLEARGYDAALLVGKPLAPHSYRAVGSGGTYTQYFLAPLVYLRKFRGWDLVVDVCNGIPFFSPLWRRRPVVCFVHHVHTDQWAMFFPEPAAAVGRWLESRLMPMVYRNCLFVTVSTSSKESLVELGVDAERVRVINNGVDVPDPAPRTPVSEEPLFVCLGRLVPHKRVELLLDMWEKVRPEVGGRFVVVGDGMERSKLERYAGPDVEFTGQVTEAERDELLERAWFLVHATMHEGWGMTVMEGAARGTPSLAFDVAGLRDSIVNDETGVLVSTTDGFIEAWIELARDPGRRDRYAAAARAWAAQHSWDAQVDALVAVLDEAAVRPGRGWWRKR